MGTRAWLAALAGLSLLAALLCWRAARAPLVADEVEFVQTGPALWSGQGPVTCGGSGPETILHHPQAFHLLLGALVSLTGGKPSPLLARLPGIVSLLLTLPLVASLARRLAGEGDPGAGRTAALLLATAPLALQAAVTVDIDTTILVPALVGFLVLLCRRALGEESRWLGPSVLGLAFGGLLWIKLPTPFLATAALGLFGLARPGRRRLALDAVVITAVGSAAFVLSWTFFCWVHQLDPWAPLAHLAGRGAAHASLSSGVIAKRALRLALWVGPWLPLAALLSMAAWRTGEEAAPARLLVTLFTLLGGLGYLFVGGEAYGFPRYHVPLLPALAALAAAGLGRARSAAWLLGGAVLAYCMLVVGDPLLPAYTFAEGVAIGDQPAAAVGGVVLAGLLWLLPGVALAIAPRLGLELRSVVLALAVSSGVALTIAQLHAGYSTTYLYGERGLEAARARLAALAPPAGLILAPKDVAFSSLACGGYRFAGRTLSSGGLRPLLEQDALSLLVLRRGDLADASLSPALQDPRVREILAAGFRQERVADFLFYVRTVGP